MRKAWKRGLKKPTLFLFVRHYKEKKVRKDR